MKLAIYTWQGEDRLGAVEGDTIRLFPRHLGDLASVIAGGPNALRHCQDSHDSGETCVFDRRALKAPLRQFKRDILCTGWNYLNHFEEGRTRRAKPDANLPTRPTFFTKSPHVVIGPHDAIAFDAQISQEWDYEVEVAVIIGKSGRSIPADRALEHVFGYCLANDVSQRDLQQAHGGQWYKGKSVDATMPFGPWIVTADEIDPTDIDIECLLNGQSVQRASTASMAFPIVALIEALSFGLTLEPGDVLLTGTPAGVGGARVPPLFLTDGDLLVSRSEVLGELRNAVIETDLHSYDSRGLGRS